MILVLGPPASGKTSYCLDKVRSHLAGGERNWRLLVPTATMAEHLRNELAREGFVFAPEAISTLAKFVDGLTTGLPETSAAALEIVTADVLKRACPPRFLPVREFAGFRRAVASAIDELTSAGGTPGDIAPLAPDFAGVMDDVLKVLGERGLHMQAGRLRHAAPSATGQSCYLTGFYSFNNPELDFIRRLSAQADVTVCLPDWGGSEAAITMLRSFATEELRMDARSFGASRELVVAPSLDSELNEITRRMLAEKAAGRNWRDMGIIVRSEEPYVPALRTALDRFGIPARFYFGTPLPAHPVIRFLGGIVSSMLAHWDHAETLETLRLTGSPLEHADRFDYEIRRRLPGAGLADFRVLAGSEHSSFFDRLEELSSWVDLPAAPAGEWQDRFREIASLFQPPNIRDGVSHVEAILLRSHSAALAAWQESVDEAADALTGSSVTCDQFYGALRTVLESRSLRPPDHRRDVVHIIDAFEARQWRLPVIFVCGLIEKHFPKYHSENPILGDDVRRQLQARGIPLRTSIERHGDERFLFDLALTRATSRLILTYPVLNAKAESNLPSFFIERAQPYEISESVDVRPAPIRTRAGEPYPGIFDEALREELTKRHASISVSSIEAYLQCGYQFFGKRTLDLGEAPPDPWDRLNPIVQGSIAHRVLERTSREKNSVRDVFDTEFAEYCRRERVPHGYRTEAIRLDLLHNLQMIEREDLLTRSDLSLYEKQFKLSLDDGTIVTGRIDRIEVDSAGRATVVDYKYSGQVSIGRSKRGHDNQTHVQGGLYMLALRDVGNYTAAGMVYCGFKREVNYGGWILKPYFMEVKEGCDQDRLHEIMHLSKEAALKAMASIRTGIIKPAPADESRCQFCSLATMCRYEKAATSAVVTLEARSEP
jgi:hypothetical protein